MKLWRSLARRGILRQVIETATIVPTPYSRGTYRYTVKINMNWLPRQTAWYIAHRLKHVGKQFMCKPRLIYMHVHELRFYCRDMDSARRLVEYLRKLVEKWETEARKTRDWKCPSTVLQRVGKALSTWFKLGNT